MRCVILLLLLLRVWVSSRSNSLTWHCMHKCMLEHLVIVLHAQIHFTPCAYLYRSKPRAKYCTKSEKPTKLYRTCWSQCTFSFANSRISYIYSVFGVEDCGRRDFREHEKKICTINNACMKHCGGCC